MSMPTAQRLRWPSMFAVHRGQHDQVAGRIQRVDDLANQSTVVLGLFPGQFALHRCYRQISHSIAVARASTSSFFAKQKRR